MEFGRAAYPFIEVEGLIKRTSLEKTPFYVRLGDERNKSPSSLLAEARKRAAELRVEWIRAAYFFMNVRRQL
jgi:hypothetical protein